MDPDTALNRLRTAIRRWHGAVRNQATQEERDAASEAIEMIAVLDSWMSKGGRPPTSWQAGSNGTPALPLV